MCTDQNMLRQVLINLIRNACEAGATTVDVRLEEGVVGQQQWCAYSGGYRTGDFYSFLHD